MDRDAGVRTRGPTAARGAPPAGGGASQRRDGGDRPGAAGPRRIGRRRGRRARPVGERVQRGRRVLRPSVGAARTGARRPLERSHLGRGRASLYETDVLDPDFERAVLEPPAQASRTAAAFCYGSELSVWHTNHGDADRAIELGEQALRLAEGEPPSAQTAFIIGSLGGLYVIGHRDLDRGLALCTKSKDIAELVGARDIEAADVMTLGIVRYMRGDSEGAVRDLLQSVEIARQTTSVWAVVSFLNTATTLAELGDFDAAQDLLEEGMSAARSLGSGGCSSRCFAKVWPMWHSTEGGGVRSRCSCRAGPRAHPPSPGRHRRPGGRRAAPVREPQPVSRGRDRAEAGSPGAEGLLPRQMREVCRGGGHAARGSRSRPGLAGLGVVLCRGHSPGGAACRGIDRFRIRARPPTPGDAVVEVRPGSSSGEPVRRDRDCPPAGKRPVRGGDPRVSRAAPGALVFRLISAIAPRADLCVRTPLVVRGDEARQCSVL